MLIRQHYYCTGVPLATIKGHSTMCSFTVLGASENQSLSGVISICLTQCNASPSHRSDQVVDCGLWNVGPPLFNGCAKLLDIGRNWNMLSYTPIQSIPNMLNLGHVKCRGLLPDPNPRVLKYFRVSGLVSG